MNGYGTAVAGKGAIYVPAEFAKCYIGKKVTGVRVGLSANTDELSVFLTRSLDEAPLLTKAAEFASSGNNTVKFDSPYEITGEAFYVGYEFKGETAAMSVGDSYDTNGNWTDLGSGWVNNATNAVSPDKALAIALRVEGDVLPMDAALTGVNNVAVRSGNSFQMTGRILNLSAEKITNVRVAYSVNGEEEKFADIEQTIGERSEAEITVDHDAIFGTEPVSYTMRLVSVNGEADAFAGNNSQSAYVLFPNTEAVKRVVMEEFTGIKCGYCPRGIVGIRTCHERFGDKFIAIAKHCYSGTPSELQASTYNYNIGGGFPKCIIDRRYQRDPLQLCTQNAEAIAVRTVTDRRLTYVPRHSSSQATAILSSVSPLPSLRTASRVMSRLTTTMVSLHRWVVSRSFLLMQPSILTMWHVPVSVC